MVELDLRGTPCPLNYIRTKLALETLSPGQRLQVSLDRGDPEQMVSDGLRTLGHTVHSHPHPEDPAAVNVLVDATAAVDDMAVDDMAVDGG